MSEYIVTARKWRPMRFEDVVGQRHVTETLRNAITAKRLAHAYLFSGPRGVGKTTTARLLAKAVNCLQPDGANPDNSCDLCKEITEGRSFDVLEIDGASNRGVEEIRNLREAVRYPPAKGAYKVYIIDEVHMLTKEAFNALLKTLEEPPTHVLFIFATTEIHKLPATILSRCQRFDFRRIAIDEITGNLRGIASREGLTIDDDALLLVARKGDGSLRDAQSIFDQVIALCGTKVSLAQILQALNIVDQEMFFRVTDAIKTSDSRSGLALVEEIMTRGYDIKEFLAGLTEHLRNLMVARTTGDVSLLETSDEYRKRYGAEAEAFTLPDLLRFQRLVAGTESAIRWSSQPRFKLEADLLQLIGMHRAPDVAELLRELDGLKKKVPEVDASGRKPAPPKPAVLPKQATTDARVPLPAPPSVAEEEIRARWPEFIGEVRRARISLGSVLESTDVLGVASGVIRIGCTDDFQAGTLTRNKEVLAEMLQKVFNARLRIEPVIAAGKPGASGATQSAGNPKPDHPIVAALKRELGAEPLE